jgi:putative transposase
MYLQLLQIQAVKHGVKIQAYCLMPNHVHLIAVPQRQDSFANVFRKLHADYAKFLNIRMLRSGHLWQSRYYSAPLSERHFCAAIHYVEDNPCRAGLADRPEAWPWSSAAARSNETAQPLLDLTDWNRYHGPESWNSALRGNALEEGFLAAIRAATQKGRPLGDEEFVEELQQKFTRKITAARRGRPPKTSTVQALTAVGEK